MTKAESGTLDKQYVEMRWGVKIPMRDGINLNATLYLPSEQKAPKPVIFTLTPYIGQTYHDVGMFFAERGYPFLAVDVRGRGNSEGEFWPNRNEAEDGPRVVEWLAIQSYCNGKVAMWGGSYGGFDQWMTATRFPPHLAAIAPVAPPYVAVDFPCRNGIAGPYLMQWLTLVSGRASQDKLFWGQEAEWGDRFRRFFESGRPFKELDEFLGNPSPAFQEWVAHPHPDAHWDSYNPTPEHYAKFSLPILSITGHYDGDQPGTMAHYRQHMLHGTDACKAQHHLIIGPWDHAGTRVPMAEFSGVKVGPASVMNLRELHRQWYAWVMEDGLKPELLKKRVAYYVMGEGAEKWRYADTLEAVTARYEPFYLHSTANANDVFHSGQLTAVKPADEQPDHYVYDPRDISLAELESRTNPEDRSEQRVVLASAGKHLVYHSAPFKKDTELTGFFKFTAWLSIDQPDTDFEVVVYEIDIDGSSLELTYDTLRARYRENPREPKLIDTQEPLRYDFERFMFVSRQIRKGNRLRLVIGPINSIFSQKNYNDGGVISDGSMKDARTVTVKLFHDEAHPSALYLPHGQPEA